MPTFTDNFNYTEDLVYGVTKQRDTYIDRWIKDKSTLYDEDDHRPTDVREKDWAEVTQKSKMFINAYNDPIIKTDFSAAQAVVPQSGDIGVRRYQEALDANQALRPQSTKTAKMSALSKGDSSQANVSKNAVPAKKLADLEGLLAIRRACKFGIEDVLKRRKDAKVHYILDTIDMADVISKKTFPLYSGDTGVPITTSELRFLFRNWNRFRSTQTAGPVLFYSNYSECEAPWLTGNLEGWAAYAMHLLEKGKVQASSLEINAAKAWASASNHKGVIGVYHNVKL